MIALATALIAASAQAVEPREVCMLNELKSKATFTYFIPGEAVPKGGYPVKRVKPGTNACFAIPKDAVSVLAKTSANETFACSPVLAEGVTQFTLYVSGNGTVCQAMMVERPAQ